jgi:glycosyltransferase involved in cell wall biosynthesis
MKLYLSPHADDVQQNNGIGQVVKAQYEHLPKFGIEFVHDPGKADIVAAHVRTDLDYLDVLHCHGLYWTAELGRWLRYHHRTNLEIVSAARKARKITVPSTWVAEVFKREMRISPEVIGHGVNLKEWKRGKNEHYILWNKNRISPACNPEAIIELHKHGLPTVSTLGAEGMNLVGVVSFEEMKQLIQSAGIYLSTSKETFGIGTLEAMACGIPVLGYAFGGNLDLIDHLESGTRS